MKFSPLKEGEKTPDKYSYDLDKYANEISIDIANFLGPLKYQSLFLKPALYDLQNYFSYKKYMRYPLPSSLMESYKKTLKSIKNKLFKKENGASSYLVTMFENTKDTTKRRDSQLHSGLQFLLTAYGEEQESPLQNLVIPKFSSLLRYIYENWDNSNESRMLYEDFVEMIKSFFGLRTPSKNSLTKHDSSENIKTLKNLLKTCMAISKRFENEVQHEAILRIIFELFQSLSDAKPKLYFDMNYLPTKEEADYIFRINLILAS
ncbi:hypothetical protein HMI56_003372 [Coelomomyces lativittatus]|nr:hypothetical protein HMI56_003372 [Coelomomyces lativittatus]